RCRSSRCGKIASNVAASIAPMSTMPPIPHQRATLWEATGYLSAIPNYPALRLVGVLADEVDDQFAEPGRERFLRGIEQCRSVVGTRDNLQPVIRRVRRGLRHLPRLGRGLIVVRADEEHRR